MKTTANTKHMKEKLMKLEGAAEDKKKTAVSENASVKR